MSLELFAGDAYALPVTLKKNGATFVINSGATVRAAFLNTFNYETDLGPFAVTEVAGSDWDNSLVIVQMTPDQTRLLTGRKYTLEIEIKDTDPFTYQYPDVIVKQDIIRT